MSSSPINPSNRVVAVNPDAPHVVMFNGDTVALVQDVWQSAVGEIDMMTFAGALPGSSTFYAMTADQSIFGAGDEWEALAFILNASGVMPSAQQTGDAVKTWLTTQPRAVTAGALLPWIRGACVQRLQSDADTISKQYQAIMPQPSPSPAPSPTPSPAPSSQPYDNPVELIQDFDLGRLKLTLNPVTQTITVSST